MCSTTTARIARICGAIEELAGSGPGDVTGTGETAGAGQPAAEDVAGRLAAIWSMIADADPELAKRLPAYLAAAERARGLPPSAS
jgi:hypothetical protein